MPACLSMPMPRGRLGSTPRPIRRVSLSAPPAKGMTIARVAVERLRRSSIGRRWRRPKNARCGGASRCMVMRGVLIVTASAPLRTARPRRRLQIRPRGPAWPVRRLCRRKSPVSWPINGPYLRGESPVTQ